MALKARETYTPLTYPRRTDRLLAPGGYRNIVSSARKTWFSEFAVSGINYQKQSWICMTDDGGPFMRGFSFQLQNSRNCFGNQIFVTGHYLKLWQKNARYIFIKALASPKFPSKAIQVCCRGDMLILRDRNYHNPPLSGRKISDLPNPPTLAIFQHPEISWMPSAYWEANIDREPQPTALLPPEYSCRLCHARQSHRQRLDKPVNFLPCETDLPSFARAHLPLILLYHCITHLLHRSGYTKAPTADENAISIGFQFPFPTTALHAESSLQEKKVGPGPPKEGSTLPYLMLRRCGLVFTSTSIAAAYILLLQVEEERRRGCRFRFLGPLPLCDTFTFTAGISTVEYGGYMIRFPQPGRHSESKPSPTIVLHSTQGVALAHSAKMGNGSRKRLLIAPRFLKNNLLQRFCCSWGIISGANQYRHVSHDNEDADGCAGPHHRLPSCFLPAQLKVEIIGSFDIFVSPENIRRVTAYGIQSTYTIHTGPSSSTQRTTRQFTFDVLESGIASTSSEAFRQRMERRAENEE
ncbi:hypothetical protein I7I51_05297 [Histoplasma capsulatum]|uniref:Uncharacterized protein n=1 Tax=Ajellomyces capsulatus TaxID=5037 RepID=A0A8A1M8H7_AJECA|nr:hypothetical protein I7I51_05297 [Histoplasma capsulatum]